MKTTKTMEMLPGIAKAPRLDIRATLSTLITAFLLIPAVAMATPPVADAGPDLSVEVGHRINLQGSATDADNDPILAYQWTLESAPVGSTPVIIVPSTYNSEFEADIPGDYVLSLLAADSFEISQPDFMTVTVYEILPPVAIATADVTTGPAPLTVNFDGSASTVDPRAGTLSYGWNFGDGTLTVGISASHTYNAEGTHLAKLTVSDSRGQADIDFIVITVGALSVSPQQHDFGDVEIGTSATAIVTLSSNVSYDKALTSVGLVGSPDFLITAPAVIPAALEGHGSLELELTFTPVAQGYGVATLEIESAGSVVPLLEVPLGGMGIYNEPPPQPQIEAIQLYLEAGVAAGTIAGVGSGNSAANRINALSNMLDAVGDLILAGQYELAHDQLESILRKIDGEPKPGDFAAGSAIAGLVHQVEVLLAALGQP